MFNLKRHLLPQIVCARIGLEPRAFWKSGFEVVHLWCFTPVKTRVKWSMCRCVVVSVWCYKDSKIRKKKKPWLTRRAQFYFHLCNSLALMVFCFRLFSFFFAYESYSNLKFNRQKYCYFDGGSTHLWSWRERLNDWLTPCLFGCKASVEYNFFSNYAF